MSITVFQRSFAYDFRRIRRSFEKLRTRSPNSFRRSEEGVQEHFFWGFRYRSSTFYFLIFNNYNHIIKKSLYPQYHIADFPSICALAH